MVSSFSEAQRQAAASYDAVIADVCQPTADAPDPAISAALRETGAAVVVLTAYGEPARAAFASRIGMADAFLHKPVSLVWLERLLRGCIAARRQQSRSAPAPVTA